jgi:hypothetical protein
MGVHSGVKIEGLRETVRNLERLGVAVEDLKEAFSSISREVVAEAAGVVPVLEGALRATIRAANTKNRAVIKAGFARNAPYAGAINYGWPAHHIAYSGFLTDAANRDPIGKARRIDANLHALIRKYQLN